MRVNPPFGAGALANAAIIGPAMNIVRADFNPPAMFGNGSLVRYNSGDVDEVFGITRLEANNNGVAVGAPAELQIVDACFVDTLASHAPGEQR